MRRKLATVALAAFVLYTGAYFFVYLFRAFRISRPPNLQFVGIYHGDDFSRVLLVGILFIIGQLFVLYVVFAARQPHRIDLRVDLWRWLKSREDLTGEPAALIAERAISHYRVRLEGGREARLPSTPAEEPRTRPE